MKTPLNLLLKVFFFSLVMLMNQLYAQEILRDGDHLTKWMCGISASTSSLDLAARIRGQSEADEQLYKGLQPTSSERIRTLLTPLDDINRCALVRQVGMVFTPSMTNEDRVDVVERILGLSADSEERGRVIYGALGYLESLPTWDKRVQVLRHCEVYEIARRQSAEIKRMFSQVFSDLGEGIRYSELSDAAQKAMKKNLFVEYMAFIGLNKVKDPELLWNLLECRDASEFSIKFKALTGSRPILGLTGSLPVSRARAAAGDDAVEAFARGAAAADLKTAAIETAVASITESMDESQRDQVRAIMTKFTIKGIQAMVDQIIEISSSAGEMTAEGRLDLIKIVTSS